MKQILQNFKTGKVKVIELPSPSVKEGYLLIETTKSLISLGTERMLLEFSKSGWLKRINQHPDKVRQVLQKVKTDGLFSTIDAVKGKLNKSVPLGYCNVGIVKEIGRGVSGFQVGDRVVSNGPHAEIVSIPKNLVMLIPDEVDDLTACFTILSSIALEGVRLVNPTLGESVVVVGLGLIGLLTVQILKANGCRVLGFDLNEKRVELAQQFGIEAYTIEEHINPIDKAISFSRQDGVDAVIITTATTSNNPIQFAPKICRKRGKIILVGVSGLNISREDFYKKEISFQVACSYGPGRYDLNYEEKGIDYPVGYVRWTEKRNFQAVLELMKNGKILIKELISDIFPFEKATDAYNLVISNNDALGIIFDYEQRNGKNKKSIKLNNYKKIKNKEDEPVIGFIGAGNFANTILIPAFNKYKCRLKTISSSFGVSGFDSGEKYGFEFNTTDDNFIFNDPDINTVVIATRHNTHAEFIIKAFKANKHVFVEKPLCINKEEFREIISSYSNKILMVDYNRRFSPCTDFIKKSLKHRNEPLCAVITINAGFIPMDHWVQDLGKGSGRIKGEVCHFVDLLIHIIQSKIKTVQAVTTSGHSGTDSDKVSVILKFQGGSIATINYFANGPKGYPKERMEFFSEGKVIVLDNFKKVNLYAEKNKIFRLIKQDKGHFNCVKSFLNGLKQGRNPIIFEDIIESTLVTFAIEESIKSRSIVNIVDLKNDIFNKDET